MEKQMANSTTSSRLAILAIVYKAVKTVGDVRGITLRDQIEIAELLGEKVSETLALAGSGSVTEVQMQSSQLDVFAFFNDVLDLIEPQIPFVHKYFNVTLTTSRFSERGTGNATAAAA